MTMAPAQPMSRTLRRSTLDRSTALQLAATEYGRYLALLKALQLDDWSRPTDCPGWDVRAMAAHNLGMVEMAASLPELVRQFVASSRRPEVGVDALTAHQVEARAGLTPVQIIERYAAAAPLAVRGRSRRSKVLGRLPMPEKQQVGGVDELWTFGYLFETILTRDTWMHRIDTSRACGAELVLSRDHDGVLVADVVREWAGRHGMPYRLELTGPAGGSYSSGGDAELHTLDALQFVRILSGRAPGAGLLDVLVPF